MMEKCKDCKWFDPEHSANDGWGGCKKVSPEVSNTTFGFWPIIEDIEWCGDFEGE